MEIASFGQEQRRDRFSPRMPSDISVISNSSAKVQSNSSLDSATNPRDKRVKLMCSYGGRILPRPSDRRLRYVGGETRMVSVPRHIHYEALLRKLTEIYGPELTVKYQLPEEDLDALVSVTSDEDLENMMDECDRLDSLEGASRLRVFVFSPKDMVPLDLNEMADPALSELRYVDAVNTVQVEASFKTSNDSNNSFGHLASGWHTPPRVHQDGLHPSSGTPAFYPAKSDDLSGFVSPPPPMVTARQHTAPLEFISIQATDRGGFYGPGAGGDDFRNLESGGSASSSTSSQHDLYNRLQWASRSQKQIHMETSPYGSQFQDSQAKGIIEDLPKKTDQMHVRINKKSGAQEIGMDVTGASLPRSEQLANEFMQFYHTDSVDAAREIAANLHGQVPLSPGAVLQRQLEADRDPSKPKGVGSVESVLDANKMQPLKLSQGQQQIGKLSVPLHDHAVKLLDADDLIPSFLDMQLFETLNNEQYPEGGLNPAQSAIMERQSNETGKAYSALADATKQHALPANLPTDLLHTDYTSGLYNEDDKERNDVSMFASQAFPKEPYNTVFQTCSSEIPLTSMDGMDELLQQVLSPTMNFTSQTSVDGYHIGINSQAPWHSPDSGSFSLLCQGNGSTLETSSNALDHLGSQAIRTPRTQNYENVQGRPPLLSELYLQGGESTVVNSASMNAESLEELDAVDKASGVLPASNSRDPLQTEITEASNLASSLSSFGELGDKHNDAGLGLSYAAVGLTELSIDDSRDTMIGLHQVLESSKGPVLQPEVEHNLVRANDEIDGLTLQSLSTISHAAPSLLEVWSTTAQSEHEGQSAMLQNVDLKKDIENVGSASIMEKDMTIDDQTSEVDDFDTFQSAADRSMSPAAAAEVEAIARGLQIIRYYDLEELKELGSGTFGTVYHGKWRGTDVAIKRIKSSCFTGRPAERERLIADFWREAYILGQLHHPNVVAFYGVVPDGPGGTLATVTEYMVNGSLKQALQKKDRTLDRRKRLLIAMDVAFGMEYLHGKNVVHFDIKCENLLVNLRDLQRPICKVGDLGLSKVKQQTMVSGGVRGTLPWMAPELLNGSSSLVSEKVDVFSFGIVLWELLTGEEPYASMHYGAIIGGIVSNTLRPPVPRWCDPAYRSLMEMCWSADPSARPNFSEIARSLRAMEVAISAKAQGQAPGMG